MAIKVSKIVKCRELGAARDHQYVCVVKLAGLSKDPKNTVELPGLCRKVQQTRVGAAVCSGVARLIKRVVDEQPNPYPFIFCCWAGVKSLVIPAKDGAYLAFCRSPELHKRHLETTSQLLESSISEIESHWWTLSRFGPQFVEAVAAGLGKQKVEVSRQVREGIKNLGEAYGMYEFDVIIYDTLQKISLPSDLSRGMVQIQFVSKPRDRPVVRVVTDEIGLGGTKKALPIIGLAVEGGYSENLKGCLELPTLKHLCTAISADRTPKFCHRFRTFLEGEWEAEVSIYLEEKPDEGWLKHVKDMICAGLDSGSGTVCTRLLRVLRKDDVETFKAVLLPRADHLSCVTRVGKRESLYSRILGDIAEAMDCVSSESVRSEQRSRWVIQELLRFLESYSVLTAAPRAPAGVNRRYLLVRDLLSGSSTYMLMTKQELIPSELKRCQYEQCKLAAALECSLKVTVESLLEATRMGEITLDMAPGKEAWRSVLNFCQEHKLEQVLGCVEEQLYQIGTTEARQDIINMCAEFVAVLLKAITFGGIYSYPIIASMRRKVIRKYLERKLSRD